MTNERLQRQTMAFVRAFGLLEPERTPCGQPMSTSTAHALTELTEETALSQRELGRRLGLEKSTVSRLVGDLERRGWLERRRDGADARVVRLHLTEQGRRVAGQVASARAALFSKLAEQMSAREHAMVERALEVLVRAVGRSKETEDEATMVGDRERGAPRRGRGRPSGDGDAHRAAASPGAGPDARPLRRTAAQLGARAD